MFFTDWAPLTAIMAVVSRPLHSIVVFRWSVMIITQLAVVNSLTFELPDRNRMCFFETINIGSQCRFRFQVGLYRIFYSYSIRAE